MRLFIFGLTGIAVSFVAGLVPAKAGQWSESGGLTSIPYGHKDYCGRKPGDCRAHRVSPPMKLTPERMQLLQSVSSSVNSRIRPVSDMDNYGKRDYWTIPANGKGIARISRWRSAGSSWHGAGMRRSFSSRWFREANRMSF